MKVLFIMGNTVFGGADVHLRKLLQDLSGKPIEPTVVCAYAGELSDWLRQRGVEVTVIPMTYWPMGPNEVARAVVQLAQLIGSRRFDIVHTHLMPAEICASFACALVRHPPLFSTIHELDAYDAQIRIGSMLGTRYICVCRAIRQKLIGAGLDPERVSIVHNDVEAECFVPLAPDRETLVRYGFDASSAVMVTLARLSPEKNLDVLLRAAQRAARIEARLRWLIVGDGPEEANLKHLAESLGLGGRVRFQPFHPRHRVPRLLSGCVAHVLPSRQEGFPLVNLEAMACGKPAIATTVGGNPEAVIDGETGLLIPVDDVEALAQAMVKLARDRALARKLGENGRKRVREKFSSPRMANAIWDLYQAHGCCRGGHIDGSLRGVD